MMAMCEHLICPFVPAFHTYVLLHRTRFYECESNKSFLFNLEMLECVSDSPTAFPFFNLLFCPLARSPFLLLPSSSPPSFLFSHRVHIPPVWAPAESKVVLRSTLGIAGGHWSPHWTERYSAGKLQVIKFYVFDVSRSTHSIAAVLSELFFSFFCVSRMLEGTRIRSVSISAVNVIRGRTTIIITIVDERTFDVCTLLFLKQIAATMQCALASWY